MVYRRLGDLVDNLGHSEAMTELVTALDRLLTTVGCARPASGTGGSAAFAMVGVRLSSYLYHSRSRLAQTVVAPGGGLGVHQAGRRGGTG